ESGKPTTGSACCPRVRDQPWPTLLPQSFDRKGFPKWRSWHTIRCSVITMTRYTSGSCSLAKIFTERRWRPWVLRHTSAVMPSNTRKLLCAFAMADGLGGSDSLCQPDLAALAGDVHRVLEHGYGIDPNGERLGHF